MDRSDIILVSSRKTIFFNDCVYVTLYRNSSRPDPYSSYALGWLAEKQNFIFSLSKSLESWAMAKRKKKKRIERYFFYLFR